MYLLSLVWSTSTEWRCEKVPRPESWPLSRTGVPSASSVPKASASPVAQSMFSPVSMVLRFSWSWRAILRLRSKPLGASHERVADRQQPLEIDGRHALAVFLARRDREAGPVAFQPVGLVGLVLGRRLERLVELLAQRRIKLARRRPR